MYKPPSYVNTLTVRYIFFTPFQPPYGVALFLSLLFLLGEHLPYQSQNSSLWASGAQMRAYKTIYRGVLLQPTQDMV